MASSRFYGPVGYVDGTEEVKRGVHVERIKEVMLYGDVRRNTRSIETEQSVNPNTRLTGNSISVVADAYLVQHFHAIRYVLWQGLRWTVINVTVEGPRLLLRLGGEYNVKPSTAPGQQSGGVS